MNLSKFKDQLSEIEANYLTAMGQEAFLAFQPHLKTYAIEVAKQLQAPHQFSFYHKQIRSPVDYYALGLEFIRPLIVFEESTLRNSEIVNEIDERIKAGANVVLLANHQIEPDPQVISLLLEKTHPELAEKMIFVAGHRVTQDPLAIPFSLGRNLLCIYSKKHIKDPPEQKEAKLLHNHKTMQAMRSLLDEGGKCIYVAPSGGRDRPNAEGLVQPAPFDPQAVMMFHVMGERSRHPTYFYPLALHTYDLFPPPDTVSGQLGERRIVRRCPVHIAFGHEIDMRTFPGSTDPDKKKRRQLLATYVWQTVCKLYGGQR